MLCRDQWQSKESVPKGRGFGEPPIGGITTVSERYTCCTPSFWGDCEPPSLVVLITDVIETTPTWQKTTALLGHSHPGPA